MLTGLEGKVTVDDLPWIPLGEGLEGNAVKILRVSEETGMYSMLIKAKAGTINQAHTHSGAADFYILEGRLEYRLGEAKAGDWMYEPAGAVHEATTATEDTLYLANVYGPIIFYNDDGSVDFVQDWRTIKALAESAAA
jgi:anti-sigma factor ChrR (cupin superfamily)